MADGIKSAGQSGSEDETIDGRVRRGERNRERILDATYALIRGGNFQPTAEEVAKIIQAYTVPSSGTLVDFLWLNPVWNIDNHRVRAWTLAIWFIQQRASLLLVSEQIDEAFDPYLFVKEGYLQHREYLIYDGNPPQDEEYFEDFEDEEF